MSDLDMSATSASRRGRSLRHALVVVLLAVAAVCLGARPGLAEEYKSLALSAGVFNVSKQEKSAEAGLELRLPTKAWKLVVATGLTVTENGSYYVFGGLRRDFSLGGGWQVTPAFGISLYGKGDGKDLGGPVEFRSMVEFSYQWPSRRRLAVGMYHLSNAGIYNLNPGANSVIMTFSFPLGRGE